MTNINYLSQLDENFNNYIIHRQPKDFTITIIADFDGGIDVKETATTANQAAKLAIFDYLKKNEYSSLHKELMEVIAEESIKKSSENMFDKLIDRHNSRAGNNGNLRTNLTKNIKI